MKINIAGLSCEVKKIYPKRAMCKCPFHVSKKGGYDLDLTIEGEYSGKYFCYSCGASGLVDDKTVEFLRKSRGEIKESKPIESWSKLHQSFVKDRYYSGVFPPLDISVPALTQAGWGYDKEIGAHTFPERNGLNEITGILRRFPDGNKGVVSGSKRGLNIPTISFDNSKTLYITEGVSDLCVILEIRLRLDLSFQGIARPNSNSGNDLVSQWLCVHAWTGKIVIVPDNDTPGIEGATELRQKLNSIQWEDKPKEAKCLDADWCLVDNRFKDLYEMYKSTSLEEVRSWLVND